RSEAGVDQLKQVLDYYVNNVIIEDGDGVGEDDSFDALNNATIDNIRSYQAQLKEGRNDYSTLKPLINGKIPISEVLSY
ncbi:5122_t:CDS:1, partial [Ambispora gerdemannii]